MYTPLDGGNCPSLALAASGASLAGLAHTITADVSPPRVLLSTKLRYKPLLLSDKPGRWGRPRLPGNLR
jgi:hypothetical protein